MLNKDKRSKFGRCSPATRPFAYAGSTSVRRLPTKCGTLKGVPNKVTAEVKAIAQEHGPEAFKRLVKITKSGTSEAVSQGSLDRAFGKSPQALVGDPIGLHNKIEFVIAARPQKRTSTKQTQTKTPNCLCMAERARLGEISEAPISPANLA